MTLLDQVLAANAAVVEHADVPVPVVPAGRRVVVVTCSEIRAPGGRDLAAYLGFAHDEAFVVANAGARVRSADGDVVRSVVVALARAGGGEVFVVAHEGCRFLEADPESVAALLHSPNSTMLQAAEALCGENFIAARKLAMTAAEMLRASPFVAARAAVHAMVFDESRGRLTAEQRGYDVVATAAHTAPVASGMSASPSPILAAHGSSGGFTPGPVSLFGSGPTPLMSAPSPLVAPPPILVAGAAAFIAPPPPSFAAPPPPPPPPGFVAPLMPPAPPATPPLPPAAEPPPLELLSFREPPPPRPSPRPASTGSGPPRPPDADDPFRKAAETLERLRRERRK